MIGDFEVLKESTYVTLAENVDELETLTPEFYTNLVKTVGLYEDGRFKQTHSLYNSYSPAPQNKRPRKRNLPPIPNSRSDTCPHCGKKYKTFVTLKCHITRKHSDFIE